jgi:hypothetical protein
MREELYAVGDNMGTYDIKFRKYLKKMRENQKKI